MLNPISQYLLILFNALLLLAGQLLIKRGLKSYGPISLAGVAQFLGLLRYVLLTPALLAGYALSLLSGLLWVVTLSRLELSYAVPLFTGIYYILLLLASVWLLDETVGWERMVGAGLVLAGIVLLTRGN